MRTVIPLATSSTSRRTRASSRLSSSFDHCVVDGAIAAAYVQCLREYLEHPATLFIE
jgi:2-oxoisovalerate dehydrogenase E2 component (dihydrolipoyl transacylase)